MNSKNRRSFFKTTAQAGLSLAIGSLIPSSTAMAEEVIFTPAKRYQKGVSPWPICLDTATIKPASLIQKIEIAAKAGYDAIEPWDGELEAYEKSGGNLKELGKKIKDLGLFVPSVIGLWNALPPTQEKFEASLPDTKRRMRMAADIGASHIQTIPNTVGDNYDHNWVASRYRDIIEIGLKEYNIQPALVFVKFFPINKLGQAMGIAYDTDHPKAQVIPDVYHMYISDGGFENLKNIPGDMIAIFQFNDAPKNSDKSKLADKHRVYPGDGILPLPQILKDLKSTGFKGCISLELYNEEYHKQDLLQVAKTGLAKTLDVIKKAGV